jgi:hypothetical protein
LILFRCCFAILLLGAAAGRAADDRVLLSADGLFRLANGERFLPLGGFHGNMLPIARLHLTPAQIARLKPYIWSNQLTDGQGHIDIVDAPDEMLDRWFQSLAGDGVSAIRLFARTRVGVDVLDLCGKLNPGLQRAFHRAFAAARPYGIRFLVQILPEPGASCYTRPEAVKKFALPRYTANELERLTPAQRRFLLDGATVPVGGVFTDPDVLACQKLYLQAALDWIAREPQVFALEVYNEQGRKGMEQEEIRWTRQIVDAIHARLPGMLVTLSHPGFGVTGFDPLEWVKPSGIDFYSSHMYAGDIGDYEKADFAAATAATSLILRAAFPNLGGEWGLFKSEVPQPLRRYCHRDAIWLSLLAGMPGFMQWTYDFPQEYDWPAKVFKTLPDDFSPEPPAVKVEIGAAYRAFEEAGRGLTQRQKQQDANLRRIFAAYVRSLDIGVPIAFTMNEPAAMSLEQFATLDPATRKQPIQSVGTYQMTWLKDAHNPVWIAYFRSRRIQQFGNQFVGVPVPGVLDIRFSFPTGRYKGRLIDLNQGVEDSVEVNGVQSFTIRNTRDDFVLVIAPQELRRRAGIDSTEHTCNVSVSC